ncbi:adenine-specific methyltransferase EcoRI-like protein [Nicoletella semolina]|uniref:Adenine-specific methyltransferase EcoRI-like protein n=1 Tax=Nicoletella semolina TaxID=271160 RepID=A0A4R2N6W8_9PAST|nr:adenine-specific methyltransferase EcoRI family protein [Nicoletella semolina]MDH2924697.1 modification methylase [Nicoletella semolina]TCP16679.1 adenine-specific methyltransferase EcoRI-like protein [Nicoletella semolina]
MAGNKNLHRANREKNDEFYTQLVDIENELRHYQHHFKDKIIFCNCDDPQESNFFRYFALNFNFLGIKKLIATHFHAERQTYKLVLDRELDLNADGKIDFSDLQKIPLQQNGDFRSPECVELLKEADIVVTNPPFSLFREYVAQLMEYEKKFVIIGNQNAITYKEIFALIKENQIWLGNGFSAGNAFFEVPDSYSNTQIFEINGKRLAKFRNCCWFTNLDHAKRHETLDLWATYSPENYPHYDNYDAIEVSKVKDIPKDWNGAMGVPITFLDKYNPEQFEILSSNDFRKNENVPFKAHGLIKDKDGAINGKPTYVRILIKHKR